MILRIAINGCGRIGRCFLQAPTRVSGTGALPGGGHQAGRPGKHMAYLTRYDSTHGCFQATWKRWGLPERSTVRRSIFRDTPERALIRQPSVWMCWWRHPERYSHRHELERFWRRGAGVCFVTSARGSDVDRTVVFGMNHEQLSGGGAHRVGGLVHHQRDHSSAEPGPPNWHQSRPYSCACVEVMNDQPHR